MTNLVLKGTYHRRQTQDTKIGVCPIDAPQPGLRIEQPQGHAFERLAIALRDEVVNIPDAAENDVHLLR